MKTAEEVINWLNIQLAHKMHGPTKANLKKELESFAKERMKYAYPDTEADGYVFCGKCGKMK